jgi:chromosome segregation ATPase
MADEKPKTGLRVLAKLDALSITMDKLLTDVERRLGNVELRLTNILTIVEIYDSKLAEITSRLNDMDSDLGLLRTDYSDLRQAIRDIDGSLGGEIEAVAQAIADLDKSMPDVQEIADDLRRKERGEWLASTKPAF